MLCDHQQLRNNDAAERWVTKQNLDRWKVYTVYFVTFREVNIEIRAAKIRDGSWVRLSVRRLACGRV